MMADDDCEWDDWEDDTFDDDVWDSSQLDLEGDDSSAGDLDELEGPREWGGPVEADDRGGGMSWSAWDVGTVFALGGWLSDRHAEQVGREIREALQRSGAVDATGARGPRSAPYPPPPSGYPYGTATGTLRVGDAVEQGALFAELTAASGEGRDWLVQAEGRSAAGGLLLLVISVVPLSAGPRMWVVAEEHAMGFAATRLVPVFQPEPTGGLAIFATDHPAEATDAAEWACAREGVPLDALTVTERRC